MTSVARTHPPFDPELAAVLAAMPAEMFGPIVLAEVPARREVIRAQLAVPDETLRRGGAIELEERTVPGPPGEPDISLLILRPANRTGLAPGLYNIHGGGMIMGDNRTGIDGLL